MIDPSPGCALSPAQVSDLLTEARARTFLLVAPLSDGDLRVQHERIMSPIIWDLGHIGHFEEVWLVEKLRDGAGEGEGLRGIYNPFENPRAGRAALALPGRSELVDYLQAVRRRVLETLVAGHGDAELVRDGFVHRMVLQHEYQHNETILQTLKLKSGAPYVAPRARAFPPTGVAPEDLEGVVCRFPGGDVRIGTDDRSAAYDNERPAHVVDLPPFDIDAAPVSNRAYLAFMEDGGYARPELWAEEGWAWRTAEDVVAPRYWTLREDMWWVQEFERLTPVDPTRPVQHVAWWEADAFARWAGKRLPTEVEWEAAATWSPDGAVRAYPWGPEPPDGGRANLDQLAFGPAPIGSYPAGQSAIGCHQMIGDVWEWTASPFTGYPGYRTFPYKEYSEVFFGPEYRVLRGGSWATRPGAVRATFRNWDYPVRRQIFSGFRCARDV